MYDDEDELELTEICAIEAGYDVENDGRIAAWLFHRLARYTRLQIME